MPKARTRPESEPPKALSTSDVFCIVIFVTNVSYSGHAFLFEGHFLFGRELDYASIANFADEYSTRTSRHCNCASLSNVFFYATLEKYDFIRFHKNFLILKHWNCYQTSVPTGSAPKGWASPSFGRTMKIDLNQYVKCQIFVISCCQQKLKREWLVALTRKTKGTYLQFWECAQMLILNLQSS